MAARLAAALLARAEKGLKPSRDKADGGRGAATMLVPLDVGF